MTMDKRRAAVAIAGACAFLNLYPTHALLPLLAAEFGAGPAELGLTVTAGTLAVALTAPLTGALSDRLGRRRMIVAAMLAVTLPTLLVGLSGSLGEMLVWRFLQGLCLPAIFAVTVALVGEEWPPEEAGDVTALYIAGTVMGGFLGRFVTAWAAEWLGWRGAFGVLAGVNLGCALLAALWLPAQRRFAPASDMGAALRGMAGHLRAPRLVATFGVGFAVLFSLVALFTYANFHLAAPPFALGTG
ncbi:MAG TPA: MFS transporter, partial [Alphaproteobacteria bacterium]|nr:MFS transporter [Alphaproteobacteria bacterium]